PPSAESTRGEVRQPVLIARELTSQLEQRCSEHRGLALGVVGSRVALRRGDGDGDGHRDRGRHVFVSRAAPVLLRAAVKQWVEAHSITDEQQTAAAGPEL